jgi:hypothetical protein
MTLHGLVGVDRWPIEGIIKAPSNFKRATELNFSDLEEKLAQAEKWCPPFKARFNT